MFSTEVSARENKERTMVGQIKELLGLSGLFTGLGFLVPQCYM